MLTKERVMDLLREQSPYLGREFGIRRIGLFGSFARGEPGESSDVDVVVEIEKPIGLRFVELVDYLEGLLGRKVDVLTPAGIQNIRRAAVIKSITESIVYV